jgi:hypothetical protein
MKMRLGSLQAIYHCVAGVVLLIAFSASALGSESGSLGGNGGKKTVTLKCGSNQRIVGYQAKFGNVLDRVRFLCRAIDENGDWGSTFGYTAWSGNSGGNTIINKTCPGGRFAASVNATLGSYFGITVLNGLALSCVNSDNTFQRVGSSNSISHTKGGSWKSWKGCPNKGLATGAKLRVGNVVDSIRLVCEDPRPAPAPKLQINPGLKLKQIEPLFPVAGYGWSKGISASDASKYKFNSLPATSNTCSNANSQNCRRAKSGDTVKDIVTSKNIYVRSSDKKPCYDCHVKVNYNGIGWSANASKSAVCNELANFGSPSAGKPKELRDFFANWRARGCP